MSYSQPPYGGYQPQPYQPVPPPRKRHTLRTVILSVAGVLVVLIAVGAAIGGTKSTPPASTPGTAAAASSSAAVAPPANTPAPKPRARVIAAFTGSGQENTRKFMIGGDGTWKLKWAYSCASFGFKGNFIVQEDGGFAGVSVNELGLHGHGSTYGYGDQGRHYLAVNSECDWTMRVVGTP